MSTHTNIQSIPYYPNGEHYFRLLQSLDGATWLDSGKPTSGYGRFDIISALPDQTFIDPSVEMLEKVYLGLEKELDQSFKDLLNQNEIPFCGGLLGYFNYEYRHKYFSISATDENPSSRVGLYRWALIQDHKKQVAFLVFINSIDTEKRQNIETIISGADESISQLDALQFDVNNFKGDLSFHDYQKSFKKIQDHIACGDCYQINFSQRFSGDFSGSPAAAYLELRKATPTPFSAFINLGAESILCLSPERFIEIKNGTATTKPIKGTIARDPNPDQDKNNAKTLQNSEKNRAENVMIVDLLRNDFSQSCKPHTVKTPKLFELESFANVHHLVSTVEGKLEEGISPLAFFTRCFPGGSITGAPKKRAMEIIDELELHTRNIYCGSLWYWSANQHFDSNIAIRTLHTNDDKIYCYGGGGIVADSTAEAEYEESIQKIAKLIQALGTSF
ncbi:MAG: aminodeoxychorismate synthase component I [Agarilytica sp.]